MQKRCFPMLLAAVVTLLVIGAAAMAQDQNQNRRGRFRGTRNRLLSLIQTEEVRKDINLDDKQQAAVKKIAEDVRSERPRGRRNFRDLSDEDREKLRAETQKRFQAVKKKLAGVLSEKQMQRLSEIHLQAQGVSAVNDPEVAAKLKLTDDQKKKLAKVRQENRDKMRAAFTELRGSDDREAAREKFTALRQAADKDMLAVLTKEQQAQWEQMQGKKIDLPRRRFGGGRRGGRSRRSES